MHRLSDRRKFQRFTVNGGALAVLEPFPIKMGRIMDISRGGIEIRYFEDEEWPDSFSALSILMALDRNVRLENIPVKTVDDFEVDDSLVQTVEKRRRSLQFGDMSAEQHQQLEKFIREHTDYCKRNTVELAL